MVFRPMWEWRDRLYGTIKLILTAKNCFFRVPRCAKGLEGSGIVVIHERAGQIF